MANFHHKTQHLVALAKGGDNSAIEQLCKMYSEHVRRMVRLRMDKEIRPKLDSIDVVQDALFSALQGIENFTYTNEGDFLRWLLRIAQNVLYDNLDKLHADKRDVRREVRLESNTTKNKGDFVEVSGLIDTATPSAIMAKKEDLDKLEKAMDRLKPEYRRVILLAKIEGLSYEEIANKLDKSTNVVGHLLSRALASLTDIFWTIEQQ